MFLAAIALLVVCTAAGYVILQPMATAVKYKRRPTRFLMVDFVWLTILAGGLLAPLSNFFGSFFDQRWAANLTGISGAMILLVVILVWWRGIATLSGLGIHSHLRRGVFLLVVVPSAIGVSLGGFFGILVGVVLVIEGEITSSLMLYVLVPLAFAVSVYVLRRVCFWVLAGAQDTDHDGARQRP